MKESRDALTTGPTSTVQGRTISISATTISVSKQSSLPKDFVSAVTFPDAHTAVTTQQQTVDAHDSGISGIISGIQAVQSDQQASGNTMTPAKETSTLDAQSNSQLSQGVPLFDNSPSTQSLGTNLESSMNQATTTTRAVQPSDAHTDGPTSGPRSALSPNPASSGPPASSEDATATSHPQLPDIYTTKVAYTTEYSAKTILGYEGSNALTPHVYITVEAEGTGSTTRIVTAYGISGQSGFNDHDGSPTEWVTSEPYTTKYSTRVVTLTSSTRHISNSTGIGDYIQSGLGSASEGSPTATSEVQAHTGLANRVGAVDVRNLIGVSLGMLMGV